jgi:hypothetical protein
MLLASKQASQIPTRDDMVGQTSSFPHLELSDL